MAEPVKADEKETPKGLVNPASLLVNEVIKNDNTGVVAEGAGAGAPDEKKGAGVVAPDDKKEPDFEVARQALAVRKAQAKLGREKQKIHDELESLKKEKSAWDEAKGDPLKLLERGGHDFGKAQEAALKAAREGAPANKAILEAQKAHAEIQKLREELEKEKLELRVSQIKAEVSGLIGRDERFDLLNSFTSGRGDYTGTDLVCDVLAEHFETTNEELTFEEAAVKAEAWLEKNYLPRLIKSKKVSSAFSKKEVKPAVPVTGKKQAEDGSALLNGNNTSEHTPPPNGMEEREDRIRRLAGKLEHSA